MINSRRKRFHLVVKKKVVNHSMGGWFLMHHCKHMVDCLISLLQKIFSWDATRARSRMHDGKR